MEYTGVSAARAEAICPGSPSSFPSMALDTTYLNPRFDTQCAMCSFSFFEDTALLPHPQKGRVRSPSTVHQCRGHGVPIGLLDV
jgi:hypothetical protein